jgi:phosphoglycolate phosphatase-like HAD superfamily hydrolase
VGEPALSAIAIDLDALGDTRRLWLDWLEDAGRRFRVGELALPHDRGAAADELDRVLGSWRPLLERFAEDRAPVYLRPDAAVSTALRRLGGEPARVGVFTDAPAELARVALAQLGAARRVELVEAGAGARERLLERLGPDVTVVETRAQLLGLR